VLRQCIPLHQHLLLRRLLQRLLMRLLLHRQPRLLRLQLPPLQHQRLLASNSLT
jgi:hypothetical protein